MTRQVSSGMLFSVCRWQGQHLHRSRERARAATARQRQDPAGARSSVATREIPPFIINEGDSYTGFSADLWRNWRTAPVRNTLAEKRNVADILVGVETGEADVGIAAISITSEREQRFDFSQPMFECGLQIMVPAGRRYGLFSVNVFRYFTQGAMPYLLGILACSFSFPGHLVWWAERKHEDFAILAALFPRHFSGHGLGTVCCGRTTERQSRARAWAASRPLPRFL